VTSVEIPVSIAAALPNLTVLDITNEVRREVASTGGSGIAFVSPNGDPSLIRVQERESGFFSDLECLLERLIPLEAEERASVLGSSRCCSALGLSRSRSATAPSVWANISGSSSSPSRIAAVMSGC